MTSPFKELVENFNRNLQILATEMFKVYNNIDLAVFTKIFSEQNLNYELCSSCGILYKGAESLRFLGPQNFRYCVNKVKRSNNFKYFLISGQKTIGFKLLFICPKN